MTTTQKLPGALRALCEHINAMADDSYLRGHPEWETIANEADAIINNRLGGLWADRLTDALIGAGFMGLDEEQRAVLIACTNRFEVRAMLEDLRDRCGCAMAETALVSLGLNDDRPENEAFVDALTNPGHSLWFKESLRRALQRDPVDAANEAEVLAELLKKRADGCTQILIKQSAQRSAGGAK